MCQVQQSDSELLEAFVSGGREHAFETLVRRHGALVHGACLRILVHSHDAEDAAQAVFLILARKAASLGRRRSIAGWLHRTATNVALNARKAIRQQQKRLQEAAAMRPAREPVPEPWSQLAPRLDHELNRLPEKYRVPLILHHMEGLTKEQIGFRLGWQEGTVSSRLHRGRALLHSRLQRVGVVLTAEAILALVAGHATASPLPPAAAVALPRAAVLLAQGKVTAAGVVPARIAELTEATLRAMARKAAAKAAAGIAGTILALATGGWVVHSFADRTPWPDPETVRMEAGVPGRTGRPDRPGPGPIVADAPEPDPVRPSSPLEEESHGLAPEKPGVATGPQVSVRPVRRKVASTSGDGLSVQGTAVLHSLTRHGDPERASCVFGLVTLESQDRADRDLLFGPDGKDVFSVTLQPDDRSRLLDLGPMPWNRVARESGLVARLARHGTSVVDVYAGHAYVGRIQDGDSDFHVVFRVEELVPGDRCALVWSVVDPDLLPGGDGPEGRALTAGRAAPKRTRTHKRQGPEPYRVRSGTATLLARARHRDFEKATYCFRFGLRDDPGRKITRNDWSIEFGNDGRTGSDEFKVNLHGGDRCRILDLGAMSWGEVDEAALPALPVSGYTARQLLDLDRVLVVPGHVYLVHCVSLRPLMSADGTRVHEVDHDFHALFRVESHVPDDTCTLSWRLISTPVTGAGEEPFAR